MVLVRSRVLLLHQYGKGLLQRRAAVHERDVDGPKLNTHALVQPRAPRNRRRNSRTRLPSYVSSRKNPNCGTKTEAGKNVLFCPRTS